MNLRACPKCGTLEERRTVRGKEQVNLDPISGLCLGCLSGSVSTFRSRRDAAKVVPFDSRMAQAGKDAE